MRGRVYLTPGGEKRKARSRQGEEDFLLMKYHLNLNRHSSFRTVTRCTSDSSRSGSLLFRTSRTVNVTSATVSLTASHKSLSLDEAEADRPDTQVPCYVYLSLYSNLITVY